jgi:hypothetical protein
LNGTKKRGETFFSVIHKFSTDLCHFYPNAKYLRKMAGAEKKEKLPFLCWG